MIYDLQKPTFWKRFSAYLLDIVLVITLAIGFAAIVSEVVSFDQKLEKLEGYYAEYSKKYDIDLEITTEEFNKLSKEEQDVYAEADKAFRSDEKVVAAYTLIFNLVLIIAAIGILLAVLCWEFIIPLFLKNGQTVGKKIFGIAVERNHIVRSAF